VVVLAARGLLGALVSGGAMAASAAARRTDGAFPSFVRTYGFGAAADSFTPISPRASPAPPPRSRSSHPAGARRAALQPHQPERLQRVGGAAGRGAPRRQAALGRFFDPGSATEVLASFTLAQ